MTNLEKEFYKKLCDRIADVYSGKVIDKDKETYKKGDILIHSVSGIDLNIMTVTRDSLSGDEAVVGVLLFTSDENGFLDFACQQKIEIQVLKKHCQRA